jgi:hypothetical protein
MGQPTAPASGQPPVARPQSQPTAPSHRPGPGQVTSSFMSDRSRKFTKPAAAAGVLVTMASVWWFALRPRRKNKPSK